MDSRLILQIVLGVVSVLIVLVGGLILYQLTRDASTEVVERVVEANDQQEEPKNPWSLKGDAAISLVERVEVETGDDEESSDDEDEADATTVGDVLEDETFVEEKLKITSAEPNGWEATWWGETDYGPSYFLVRYAFEDANIKIGPTWLVDLKTQKVVPKNVLAKVAENPKQGMESEYYDKRQQVVSAITNHRFDTGLNLGGALLMYFEKRTDTTEDDTILGWTIDHDRGDLFEAYFQWEEAGEPTYAHFTFDYDLKALRAVNLQAANIMRAGEEFEASEPANIMPKSYNPDARRSSERWLGPARKACRMRKNRARCSALASILQNDQLIESLEWLLTAQAGSKDDFDACLEKRNCRWMPERKGENEYRVIYVYNLKKVSEFNRKSPDEDWSCPHSLSKKDEKDASSKGNCVAWDINVKTDEIVPVDATSELAYRAIHPRG
jgi:hypothetical protein